MPTHPRIEFDVPDGWLVKEEITLMRDEESPDGLSPNLIASSVPTESELDTEDFARSMTERLRRDFPAYRELGFESIDLFDGRPGWLRRFEWEPERGRRITQLQAYYTERGRAYTLTATVETDDFEQQRDSLVRLLMSLSLRESDHPSRSSAPPTSGATASGR